MKKKLLILISVIVAIVIYLILRKPGPTPPPSNKGWKIYNNMTGGSNLSYSPGTIDALKKACIGNNNCGGFTTDGTLLSAIPDPKFFTKSQYDLYVQDLPVPSNYQVYPQTFDNAGNSYTYVGGGTPAYIAEQCDKTDSCTGFTTNGSLWNALENSSYFTGGQQYDLYVKKMSTPKGYKYYPKSTSGSNITLVGAGVPSMIADACNDHNDCDGFNMDGTLLSGVSSNPLNFQKSPYDMYVKI